MSLPPAPSASVIIPAHNPGRLLREQLDALAAQQDVQHLEVLVCDNGSTDGTEQLVRRAADELSGRLSVRCLPAGRRRGAAHARNVGAWAAAADVLLFCDADDVVGSRWATTFLAGLAEAGDRAIVIGHEEVTRINPPSALALFGRTEDTFAARGTPPTDAITVASTPIYDFLPHVPGGSFAVRRSAFLAVGGFDESLWEAAEDTDFGWRAQLHGMTVRKAPEAVIDYRLRDDVRAAFRQSRTWGRTRVLLCERYRPHGLRTVGSPRGYLRRLPRHVLNVVRPEATQTRGSAMRQLGDDIGFLEGTLRYRLLRRIPQPELLASPARLPLV